MTAIAIWLSTESLGFPSLWAAADSLISRNAAPLIGDAAKLFSMPVICRKPGPDGFFSDICSNHSYGYAFAGSTLVGQNTFLSLHPLLTNLIHTEHYTPSLNEVAIYIFHYFSSIFEDLRVTMGPDAMFTVALFGWCPVENSLALYRIRPEIAQSQLFEIKIERIDLSNQPYIYIGDYSEQISELVANSLKAESIPGRPQSRAPKNVILDCINSDAFPTVGGDLQVAIADPNGFQPYMIYRPRSEENREVVFTYLGRIIEDNFLHVGGARVSLPALP